MGEITSNHFLSFQCLAFLWVNLEETIQAQVALLGVLILVTLVFGKVTVFIFGFIAA